MTLVNTYSIPSQPGFTYLVGVESKREDRLWTCEDSLAELVQLAKTAGLMPVGQTYQRLVNPHPATYIGSGKVEEIKQALVATGAETVVFDDELSPAQQRNLERSFGENIKVLDRTALILDIFAQHARTHEGQLQVELAQYEYRLPRLTRMWTHLARQAGGGAARGGAGGVGLRGPGETQLEVDRREIGRKIAQLKRELEEVRRHRRNLRRQRDRTGVPIVAIVGYTNAGKSSLLNCIADANVLAENKLFATLDPTVRRVALPDGLEVLFTDTVGFIQKLPTDLVAAFRATLEEIAEADMLLHVVDITHTMAEAQMEAVEGILEELGVADKPMVLAWNKIDQAPDASAIHAEAARLPDVVPVSALTGEGMSRLLSRIEEVLMRQLVPVEVEIPYDSGEMLNAIHQEGLIEAEEHGARGTHVKARVPKPLAGRLTPYEVNGERR
ncbi:MAG: GTPase HflX [Ardenticatenaceae bacterium]|nr:GTPase HflX [Ardenticatenaceae bacterium]HBY97572.1 GTPase HflX [Chloroflexota bacterium]